MICLFLILICLVMFFMFEGHRQKKLVKKAQSCENGTAHGYKSMTKSEKRELLFSELMDEFLHDKYTALVFWKYETAGLHYKNLYNRVIVSQKDQKDRIDAISTKKLFGITFHLENEEIEKKYAGMNPTETWIKKNYKKIQKKISDILDSGFGTTVIDYPCDAPEIVPAIIHKLCELEPYTIEYSNGNLKINFEILAERLL